jgi:hypothetical protein
MVSLQGYAAFGFWEIDAECSLDWFERSREGEAELYQGWEIF